MICLLLLQLVGAESFIKYEDVLSDLESFSTSANTELLEIGKTIDGNAVSVLTINTESVYNCLVVGGIHANEQSSTSQVLEDIRRSLERQKVLEVNLWFIPVLNPDAYLQMQEYYLQDDTILEIFKNQRDTDCGAVVEMGVDLNRNFAEGSYSKCNQKYQGEFAFSEPESQVILGLLQEHEFQLIITYFAGDLRYVVPESYPTNLDIPFVHEEFHGSLAEYANSIGIFSVIGFVSTENRPTNFEFFGANTRVFFELLHRISPGFYTSSEYEVKDKKAILTIQIENRSIYDSEESSLIVESSGLVREVKARIEYKDKVEEFEEIGENSKWEVNLRKIKAAEVVEITFILGLGESDGIEVTFWVDQELMTNKDIISASIGEFNYYFIGTAALVLVLGLSLALCPCLKNREDEENRKISIPTRPLPWEFL